MPRARISGDLLEQGDLGAAASSASPRLIHGDLPCWSAGLWRVRAALAEREIWLRIAPHLVRPMRFVIPAHSDERPPWLLRAGLLLYDRLARAARLPASATVDVTHHPIGNALKRPFGTAFEYSDCMVDNSRLVIANAVDAAERGADIRTGARCVRADRLDIWRLVAIDRGHRQVITARALANATGAWTASVAETVLRMPPPEARREQDQPDHRQAPVRYRQCLCVPEQRPAADLRQPLSARFHADRHRRAGFQGRSRHRVDGAAEVAYLCDAANRYFREQIDPADVVRTISGANAVRRPPAPRGWPVTFDHGAARRRC